MKSSFRGRTMFTTRSVYLKTSNIISSSVSGAGFPSGCVQGWTYTRTDTSATFSRPIHFENAQYHSYPGKGYQIPCRWGSDRRYLRGPGCLRHLLQEGWPPLPPLPVLLTRVETCGATLTRNGVSAYLFSGTSCSASEKEQERPVHVGELAGAGGAVLRNVELTMAGRYADKVWG